MSIHYTLDNIRKMREAAGLGTLAMGVCGISGELVSSTPIPGSRCGHEGQNPADYGGYLVGEGMTPAIAIYFANLHNWFPALAAAVPDERAEPCGCVFCTCEDPDRCHGCGARFCKEHDPQGDTAYLESIKKVVEGFGWNPFEGALTGWIQVQLQEKKRRPTPEEWDEVNLRAEKAEADRDRYLKAFQDAEVRLNQSFASREETIEKWAACEQERDAAAQAIRMLAEAIRESCLSSTSVRKALAAAAPFLPKEEPHA